MANLLGHNNLHILNQTEDLSCLDLTMHQTTQNIKQYIITKFKKYHLELKNNGTIQN